MASDDPFFGFPRAASCHSSLESFSHFIRLGSVGFPLFPPPSSVLTPVSTSGSSTLPHSIRIRRKLGKAHLYLNTGSHPNASFTVT